VSTGRYLFLLKKGEVMQGWSGPLPKADVRNIEDMYDVLSSPDCQETGPLYFMYRDLALTPSDRRWLRSHHLRYEKRRGAAYYERTDGTFVQNPAYTHAADLRRICAGKVRELLHAPSGSIYAMIRTDRLNFLNHPEKAGDLFREALKD
jgi:hypothetical protein